MRRFVAAALVVVQVALVTSCTAEQDPTVVALLLGSSNSARWTESDEPSFRARLEATCPDCDYITRNADGDPDLQARQLQEVLDRGADVVVLNAVTAERGEELVTAAGTVPVVAYDRFVAGADYYVSYDAAAIGTLMARGTVRLTGPEPTVLLLNGAQTDPNGVTIKRAVRRVLDGAGARIVAEHDPASWSADEARRWVAGQLQAHPARTLDAILAANDSQAQGVAEALEQAKVPARFWPVVTGQDADLEALRRLVTGQQALTVYKSFPTEAERAADIAVALVTGARVTGVQDFEGVPSFVFKPQVVTLDNLTDTVVRDGAFTTRDICDESLLARCEELGLR